jgi:hypothetical protein
MSEVQRTNQKRWLSWLANFSCNMLLSFGIAGIIGRKAFNDMPEVWTHLASVKYYLQKYCLGVCIKLANSPVRPVVQI